MTNSYTEADANVILNNPGVFYFREFGSTGSYIRSIFTNGSSFNYTPEIFTQEFDAEGEIYDTIGKETGAISFSIGKIYDLDYMSKLSGSAFTKEVATSGSQVVEDQVISGFTNLGLNVLILEDSDGNSHTADGEPGITSVTAATAGVLVAGDDYFINPDPNSISGYSISFNTDGTKEVGIDDIITIIYNDPTVTTGTYLYGGGNKTINAIEGYFLTELKDGTPARVNFYKGYYNANLNITFGTSASPEAATSDVSISLKLDTSKPENKQMFSLWKAC